MHDDDATKKSGAAPSPEVPLEANSEKHEDTSDLAAERTVETETTKDESGPIDRNLDKERDEDHISKSSLAEEHQLDASPDQTKDVERGPAGTTPKETWSVYTTRQKKILILTASFAAFFSPLSGQIYFPALNAIAADLQVSDSLVNLTVTTYLIMQGLAPSFIGTLSDDAGRRTAYVVTFFIYSVANIGLALQNNYAALLVLRCLQSGGSSGTVALANAVVADLVTSAERGKYIMWTSVAPMLGPSVGPIIGGVLSQYVNWHFIFWFLLMLTAVIFGPMVVFFPETCRKIVGNGSTPPPKWLRCYTNVIIERKLTRQGQPIPQPSHTQRIRFPNPLSTLVLLFRKEVGFTLLFSGLVGASFYAIAAIIPSQFGRIYGYNQLYISLCYIPLGVGAILSAVTRGRTIDARFRVHALRLGYPVEKNKATDLSDFPIERARLEVAIPMIFAGSLATIVLGWVVQYGVHISVPLICLFVIGGCTTAAMSTVGVLIIDIHPGKAGTVTASNNLVRCWLGAASTAAVVPMAERMGIGWSGTFFGALTLVFSPGLWYIMKQGPKWRRARRDKELAKEKAAEAKHAGEMQVAPADVQMEKQS